jgi:uroporphyrinogen decarboxylase
MAMGMTVKPILQTLSGQVNNTPPLWVMRQAGRYLPEYRKLRAGASSFIDFCLNPKMASEATLQPIKRFDLDAAIVFADILLIPYAMGRDVRFVAGEGPKLRPLTQDDNLKSVQEKWDLSLLESVGETLERTRADLPDDVALIGFAGAPWTVATYMVEGGGSKDKWQTRLWAMQNPQSFDHLMDILVEASIEYMQMQVKAGAEVLKLFESWAEGLPEPFFERFIIRPAKAIVDGLRERGVSVPIIGFARGCGLLSMRYAQETGITALGLDQAQPGDWFNAHLPKSMVIQGNLDPAVLRVGGEVLKSEVMRIKANMSGRAHIFNLGHGITLDTPPEHMAELVRWVKTPL